MTRKYWLTVVVLGTIHNSKLQACLRPSPRTLWPAVAALRSLCPGRRPQIFVGLMVSIAAALLVARFQPYKDPLCGRVQLLALVQIVFVYVCGFLFFDDGSRQIMVRPPPSPAH